MFKNHFWQGMFLNIRRFVGNCDVCCRNKIWEKNVFETFTHPEPNLVNFFIDFVIDLLENEKCNFFNDN